MNQSNPASGVTTTTVHSADQAHLEGHPVMTDPDPADIEPPPGKTELHDAHVFIHVPTPDDNATVTHIDVCHPALGEILNGGATYFGSTSCGGFVGLKESMIPRAHQAAAALDAGRRWQQCTACGYGWHDTQHDDPVNYCPDCGTEHPTVQPDVRSRRNASTNSDQ